MVFRQPFLLFKTLKRQWLSRSELKKIQFRQLRSLIKHAYYNVPYYRKKWKKLNIDINSIQAINDIKKLPLINKEILRRNYYDFIADNYPKKPIIDSLEKSKLRLTTKYAYETGHPTIITDEGSKIFALFSSGTIGPSLPILYDRRAWIYAESIYLRSFIEEGYNLLKPIVYHWSTPFKKRIYNYFGILRKVQIFPEMSEEKQIQILKNMDPEFIFYPPTALFFLSKRIKELDIILSPKAIFTSGEILTPKMRCFIEKVFNTSVFDHYSASEFDYISWQCEKKNLYHINTDSVILESINSENLSGYGEAVITNLFNYLMPLIRYNVGDVLKLKSIDYTCGCKRGLPLMEKIGGRASKVIKLNSGKTFVPHSVIDNLAGIKELKKFRIIYKGQNRFLVKVNIDNELKRVSNRVRENLRRLFKEDIKIVIERASNISKEKSGKINLLVKE